LRGLHAALLDGAQEGGGQPGKNDGVRLACLNVEFGFQVEEQAAQPVGTHCLAGQLEASDRSQRPWKVTSGQGRTESVQEARQAVDEIGHEHLPQALFPACFLAQPVKEKLVHDRQRGLT